jgi:hypothetical protein
VPARLSQNERPRDSACWLLVVGSHAEDKLYGDALRRSAKRFGARIVQEKVFEDTGGARRTDSGVVQIQRQLPVFTQGAPAYDVLVAADDFAKLEKK